MDRLDEIITEVINTWIGLIKNKLRDRILECIRDEDFISDDMDEIKSEVMTALDTLIG